MTPFETFFAGEFQRRVQTVKGEPGLFSNGGRIEDASWDRRAAYLLWVANRSTGIPVDDDNDLLGPARTTHADIEDLL